MTDEKRYLTELGTILEDYAKKMKALTEEDGVEQLRTLLEDVLKKESVLREACDIGARFNVIKTQLQLVLDKFEQDVQDALEEAGVLEEEKEAGLAENEMIVYVYLYNSQGGVLKSWQNLLLPSALIEHSVNRPIYAKQEDIEAVLRSKPNPSQHAYIAVVVKRDDVMESARGESLKDVRGFTLLRLRQGALKIEHIKSFSHLTKQYKVTSSAEIVPV